MEFAREPAPDPALGIFETVLVVDGQPQYWERHRERLAASADVLYGIELPRALDQHVAAAASAHRRGRLRVDITATDTRIEAGAIATTGVTLGAANVTPVQSDPHGPHKLSDRRWLERIEAQVDRPLLVSSSGTLFETSRANVFLLRGGILRTPPLDGAILPGVIRGVVLEHAAALGIETHEQPLTLADLEEAEIVLLTNSIRLLERSTIRSEGPSAAVADALARGLSQDRGRRAPYASPA